MRRQSLKRVKRKREKRFVLEDAWGIEKGGRLSDRCNVRETGEWVLPHLTGTR